MRSQLGPLPAQPGCVRLHRTEWLQGKVLHWTDLYRFAAFIILAEQGLSPPPPSLSLSLALTLRPMERLEVTACHELLGVFYTNIDVVVTSEFPWYSEALDPAPVRLEGCCLLGAFQLRRRLAVGRLDVSALLQIQTPSSIFRLLAHNSSGVNYNAEF